MSRPVFDSTDYNRCQLTGSLGYLLFFIPLLACPKSSYGRFCANQGLLGLIVYLCAALAFGVVGAVLGWIPLIGWLIRTAGSLVKLGVAALMIYYGWKAFSGRPEPLPYIGGIQLIR